MASYIDGKQLKLNSTPINRLSDTIAGHVTFGTGIMLGITDSPVLSTDIANKGYVDTVAAGLDPKQSVKAATTSDLGLLYNSMDNTLSGTIPSIDGYVLNVGDRLLVKDQTDPKQNGIYTLTSASTLTRAVDADNTPYNEVSGGNYTFVEQGVINNSTGWVLKWTGNVVLNTDPVNWVQFTGLGIVEAGAGLNKNANTIFVVPGTAITTDGDQVNVKYDPAKFIVDPNNQLTIKPHGISESDMNDLSVSARTITTDVAGLGLVKSAFTGALDVNIDNTTLTISTDVLSVKDDGISEFKLNDSVAGLGIIRNSTSKKLDAKGDETSITVGSGGISIKDSGVTANKVNSDVAGFGLSKNSGTGAIDVNVDNITLQIISDIISVKNITANLIDPNVAGNGLVKNSGNGALDVNVDNITLDITSDIVKVKTKGISTNEIKSNNTASAGDTVVANSDGTFTFTNLSAYSAKLRESSTDRHQQPLATFGQFQPTGVLLRENPKGYVMVYVNGQYQNLTDNLLGDCYFSMDGGVTATAVPLITGSFPVQLYWNGTNAGFDLESTDFVDLIYEV